MKCLSYKRIEEHKVKKDGSPEDAVETVKHQYVFLSGNEEDRAQMTMCDPIGVVAGEVITETMAHQKGLPYI